MSTTTSGLKDLHQLHVQLQHVQEQLGRGPRQIRAQRQLAERKQSEVDSNKERLTQLKMAVDLKSLQLKTNEGKIAELKTKLNVAASNREFDIIKSQIDADTMANSVLEDEILESLDKIDQIQAIIGKFEEEFATAKQEEQRVASEVAAAEPGLNGERVEFETALKTAEGELPAQITLVYRRLVQAHSAGALAPVENKACTACFAILSPNLLVELNTGKIIFCSSCGRLLYLANVGA